MGTPPRSSPVENDPGLRRIQFVAQSLGTGDGCYGHGGDDVKVTTTAPSPAVERPPESWHGMSPEETGRQLETDLERGLAGSEAAARLERDGPNALQKEVAASVWKVAFTQARDPMNIMLVVVAVLSVAISEISTAVIVGVLV